MLRSTALAFVLSYWLFSSDGAHAQDVTVTTLATGLGNPVAVAIRPEGSPRQFEIFYSDAGRRLVRRIRSDAPGEIVDAVSGFADGTAPHGLYFLDHNRLVVGLAPWASAASGLLIQLGEVPTTADQAVQKFGYLEAEDAEEATSLSTIAFARTKANDQVPDLLIASVRGAGEANGLWKIPVRAGTLEKPTPFLAAEGATSFGAVAVSKQGYLLAAAETTGAPADRQVLIFFNPLDATRVMELPIDLTSIQALAYSPRTGNLYAAALGSGESAAGQVEGGVYRIDDASLPGKPACRAVKITGLVHPTGLVFGPDGSLYVAVAGDGGIDQGSLIRLEGDL